MAEKPMYDRFIEMEKTTAALINRVVNLEQQVANQALAEKGRQDANLKSQAAATQATEHLYAPLRSDTKPLLEMSAFVRKVAWVDFRVLGDGELVREFIDTIIEAREILKRST